MTANEPAISLSVEPGYVTLVGAGPGGVDLITVRGLRAIRQAEVVVYDRLADPELLTFAPAAAERIPVGKGHGFGPDQRQIEWLLIEHARRGRRVVRLKGGDAFVFGRGGEEVTALEAAGIRVEVVPGISSALAVSLAGIPVTDRRHASSFTVLTGHAALEPGTATVPATGTLVVLMASRTADRVAQRLLEAGRRCDEPVAFVHRVGHPDQRLVLTTLEEAAVDGCPFGSPTVMAVGDVVTLAEGARAAAHHATMALVM